MRIFTFLKSTSKVEQIENDSVVDETSNGGSNYLTVSRNPSEIACRQKSHITLP